MLDYQIKYLKPLHYELCGLSGKTFADGANLNQLQIRKAVYFVIATFLGIMPASAVINSIGNGLGAVIDAGKTPPCSRRRVRASPIVEARCVLALGGAGTLL